MPALLMGLVTKVGVKWLVFGLVGAGLLATAAWFIHDYQSRGEQVALLRRDLVSVVDAAGRMEHEARLMQKQLQADLVSARKVSTRRAQEARGLRDALAAVHTAEIKDENQGCPVHPAIDAALDGLRLDWRRPVPLDSGKADSTSSP